MNRKGYVNDIVLFVIIIFVVGVMILIAYMVIDGISTAIGQDPNFGADDKAFISGFRDDFSAVWDYTFLTAFIAGLIGLLVLSWVLQSQPAVFFAILMVVVIVGVLAGSLSNGYEAATDSGILGATATNFPILDYVMSNLLVFVLVTAFLMLIVFFAKPGGEGV